MSKMRGDWMDEMGEGGCAIWEGHLAFVSNVSALRSSAPSAQLPVTCTLILLIFSEPL